VNIQNSNYPLQTLTNPAHSNTIKLDLKCKYLRKIKKDKSGPACRSVGNEKVRY
jgi:hypothetical protein